MKILLSGFNTLGFAVPIISELFMFIDHIIYWIANLSLQAFFVIEEKSANLATSAPEIEYILNRVMVLAGIFALFMISLRLINYLINPDKVKDLQKSATSVITSIIIAIILLVSCKLIFKTLGDLEHRVFTNQLIPKIVYGPNSADERGTIEEQSEQFVNNVWLLFYTPKDPNGCTNSNAGSCAAYNRVKNGDTGSILALVGTQYTDFDYLPIVSGIVGIVLIFYFIRFAIDLGIRIVQLFVLQVISPIPIIMSVDPSRKKQLTTFATTYLGVYAQVFLRVLTFYIAFIAVNLVGALPDSLDAGATSGMLLLTDANMFVKVILIIGIFQSVSRLPKLIEDALGLKLGIDTSAKGFGGVLKGILGGTAGFIGGGIAGGLTGGAGGALAGAASGMWSGGMGAAASKNAAAGVSAVVAAVGKSGQIGRQVNKANGLLGYGLGRLDNFTGRTASIDRTVTSAGDRVDAFKHFEDAVLSDFSRSVDPGTGLKMGSIDQDAGVMLAKSNLSSFVDEYSRATVNPATGDRIVNGTTYSASAAKAHIDSLRSAVDTAEEGYKLKAFNWFNTQSLDPTTSSGVKYDPKKYSTMSDSEKAHYELTRINKGKALTPDTASGKDLRTTFKDEQKVAKKAQTEAKDAQQTDRYRNAQAAAKK